jgi:hypothetical protein
MTAQWPTTPITARLFSERIVLPEIRIEYEAGYDETRRRGTSAGFMEFSVGWSALPEAEYRGLQNHFRAHRGGTFTFTTPYGEDYTVTYAGDYPQARCVRTGAAEQRLWSISGITLKEA